MTNLFIDLREVRLVPSREEIVAALNAWRHRYNTYVFTTGGIGPTPRRHSRRIRSPGVRGSVRSMSIRRRGVGPQCKRRYPRWRQADERGAAAQWTRVPASPTLVENKISTAAPGFRYRHRYVMAGLPSIMRRCSTLLLPAQDGRQDVVRDRAGGAAGRHRHGLCRLLQGAPRLIIGS